MFRRVRLSITRSFSLFTQSNGVCHTGLLTACEPARRFANFLLFHFNIGYTNASQCKVTRTLPVLYVFLFVGWDSISVKLPAPILIFEWICNILGMMIGRGNPKFPEEDLSQCESVQMNGQQIALGSNLDIRNERTNRLEL